MATATRTRGNSLNIEKANLAAMYVRMSTEHQRYSTEFQSIEIEKYAQATGLTIVRTYSDEAKSGLNLSGRPGLRQLMVDVGTGHAPYGVILVYDVSRWGRFQDTDESAHYEYLCRTVGVRVIYCAEPFKDDGSPLTLLVKSIKRVMAAEYSRELSAKVFAAKARHALRGFHTGGPPIYGLRRLMVAEDGTPKGLLGRGECRALKSDRVLLVQGPAEEIETVQWIFAAFVEGGLTPKQITVALNKRGSRHTSGRPWDSNMICKMLENEKYAGVSVWNKASYKLKGPRVVNTDAQRIRVPAAIEPIISEDLFSRAQKCRADRRARTDPEKMLEGLRLLFREAGQLSYESISACPSIPSAEAYIEKFGGLLKAYELVGYEPRRNYRNCEATQRRVGQQRQLLQRFARDLRSLGVPCEFVSSGRRLVVSQEVTVVAKVLPPHEGNSGITLWYCKTLPKQADIYIIAREFPEAPNAEDYFVVPASRLPKPPFNLSRESGPIPQAFHVTSLRPVTAIFARTSIGAVAC